MPRDGLAIRGFALTVYCTDKERSDRFYREILGAKVDPRDGYGNPWYKLGGLRLTLCCNAEGRSPASFPTHAMSVLWLDVDDLKKAADRFARYGVQIIELSDGMFIVIAHLDRLEMQVW